MIKNRQTNGITALYERLSDEDGIKGPSNSIVNQQKILEEYAKNNGFCNIRHYSDDGLKGSRFDRPNFVKMMEEVEKGNVTTVITKDLSRFGRDHLRVGLYMEALHEHGVRFIAIHDNVDTDCGVDDLVPFRNILNEMYARDCSKKIKNVIHAKGRSGKRLTTVPIYGYTRDLDDKDKWIIDPEAAEIVRRIFLMTMSGLGPHEIAKVLTNDKIERPSYYMNRRGIVPYKHLVNTPHTWNGTTVSSIISKLEYTGATVNFRYYKESYKDKTSKGAPKEDWAIFPDTHESIIDFQTWETAQKCRKTRRRTDSLGEANPLTGKMFCADCGARMYNHRKPYKTPHYQNPNTGKMYMRCPSDVYSCSNHDISKRKFEEVCTLHHIRTAVVRELVLDAIRRVSGYVLLNEGEFVEKIREASAIQHTVAVKAHRKQISKNERRIAELDMLFRKTYEDNSTGKLSDERFEQLSGAYESEQTELKEQNAALQADVDNFDADSMNTDRFISIVKKYTDFTELTTPMINEFVDKILVHEAEKTDGKRVQQVDIYFNFVGNFDIAVPEPEMTAEELETERKLEESRAKRREYERRYRAKKKEKAAQLAKQQAEENQITA